MRLPPTSPIWNLRLFRRVMLVFPLGLAIACLGNLCLGAFKTAAGLAIPAVLFGLQWRFARRFTLLAERWQTRHGSRAAKD